MLNLANVERGSHVLDVAAGAGGQTLAAARRVGSDGYVLATDISSNILEYAAQEAQKAGLTNVETRVLDGENLEVESGTFDAVISRVGLIYFPDQHKALTDMYRALKPGGRVAAIVYSTAENNKFFSIPVAIIRRRAQLPPPLPGQPGPFSLGSPGVLEELTKRRVSMTFRFGLCRCTASHDLCRRISSLCPEVIWGASPDAFRYESEAEREDVWNEIEQQVKQFEGAAGYEGPCELIIGVGVK